MLSEPKKSHIYLKRYTDIEKEFQVGSTDIRAQIWHGARLVSVK